MKMICEYCLASFEAKRVRRSCGRSCAAKLAMQTKGKSPWRKEEIEVIESLIGSAPLPSIIKAVQALGKRNGWKARTSTAVKVYVKRHFSSVVPVYDNFNRSQLADALGISRDRVRQWTRSFGLPYKRWANSNSSIRLSDFKRWAATHPKQLAGISSDRLNWFLPDAEFCKQVESLTYEGAGIRKPVRNIDSGVVYKSVRQASAANYVTKSCIIQAIDRNGKSAGCRWEYVDRI